MFHCEHPSPSAAKSLEMCSACRKDGWQVAPLAIIDQSATSDRANWMFSSTLHARRLHSDLSLLMELPGEQRTSVFRLELFWGKRPTHMLINILHQGSQFWSWIDKRACQRNQLGLCLCDAQIFCCCYDLTRSLKTPAVPSVKINAVPHP